MAGANPLEVDKSLTLANSMGASLWRTIVQPAVLQKHGWSRYDLAVTAAAKKHMKINVTAACGDVNWTEASFRRYALSIPRRYGALISEVSICNEVNRDSQLKNMPGLSRPQTYRRLYQVAQKAIAAKYPQVNVFYGELSSGDDPVGFAKAAAQCPAEQSNCAALEMANFSYHPYQLTSSPDQQTPEAPGIGTLSVVEDEIQAEFEAGQIETPEHKEPQLALTEFGYWAPLRGELTNPRTPANLKPRYLPDWIRRSNYRMALNIACNDQHVSKLILYGMNAIPHSWPGFWNTSLVNAKGKTTGTFKMIKDYSKLHEECIEPTASPAQR
ncbi:MAG: hypothetical protein JWL89_222 [Candidatus Saccharibacteria bacterium]|nr:hypothetical protein [Candidatus Saccharibacteria bacterium]